MSSSGFSFESLLGPSLVDGSGAVTPTSSLDGKHVMIYFSAHWCPPCRGFTPSLAKFVAANKDKANFEAVFVSSDRDEGSFKEYLATMGFRALPFADRERKASLSAKFKVQGIPTLVVVGPDGQTITTKGREAVSKDPTAENFPWTPKTILQALFDPDSSGAEPEFVAVDGSKVTAASLQENDVLGLYFSAHWCPPCRGFTPTLASWYKDKKPSAKPPMDLVFISSDKTKDEFDSYHREMGFPALAFADRKRKEDLSEVLGVEGIPTLVFIDPKTGKVLVKDGRARVTASPDEFPWPAKPVEPVDIACQPANSSPTTSNILTMKVSAIATLFLASSCSAFVVNKPTPFSTKLEGTPYLKSLTGGATMVKTYDQIQAAPEAAPAATAPAAQSAKNTKSYLDMLNGGAASVSTTYNPTAEAPAAEAPSSGYSLGLSGGTSGAGNGLW